MIDLNLIPEHLRRKRRTPILNRPTLKLPPETIIGLIGGLIAILVIIQVSLFLVNWGKTAEKKRLESEWQEILPNKSNVDRVVNELRSLKAQMAAVEKMTTTQRVLWAPKLNAISDSIPRGIWLGRITLEDGVFMVEGSTLSKMADDTTNVSTFAANLKKQKNFMTNIKTLDIGPIQRQNAKNIEVADFSITAKLQ